MLYDENGRCVVTGPRQAVRVSDPAKVALEDLLAEAKALWRQACDWENVPQHAAFAVFSDDNPFARGHSEVMMRYFRSRAEITGEALEDEPRVCHRAECAECGQIGGHDGDCSEVTGVSAQEVFAL